MIVFESWEDFRKWIEPSENGCLVWTGAKQSWGYGVKTCNINGQKNTWRMHRVSYALNVGPIPGGMQVLHQCDNPPCVNPDHLFLGTNDDNRADMVKKRRGPEGTRNGMNHFTPDQVNEIRKLRSNGVGIQDVADRFGCSISTVSRISHYQTHWSYNPEMRKPLEVEIIEEAKSLTGNSFFNVIAACAGRGK